MPQNLHLQHLWPPTHSLPLHLAPMNPCEILAIASQSVASHPRLEEPLHPYKMDTATDVSRYFLHSGSCTVYLPTMEMLPSQIFNNNVFMHNDDLSMPDNDLQVQNSIDHSQQQLVQQSSQYPHQLGQPSEPHKHPSQSPYQSNLSTSASIVSPISNQTQLCHPQITLKPPAQLTGSHRRRLTPDETEYLLRQYQFYEKPTTKDRSAFAAHLNLHPRTIQVWFQNRRAKLRREKSLIESLSSSQGTVRSNGDNDTQYDSNIQDALDDDNWTQNNLRYDIQSMVTKQVDETRQNRWKGKKKNGISSPEFNPKMQNYHEMMEDRPVAPYLDQWRCEEHCDHGHRSRSRFPCDPTESDSISAIGQQNQLMLNGKDQVLIAESPSRSSPPFSHSSNDSLSLVPSVAVEPATHDPHCQYLHRQQRQRRRPLQQRYSMKRIQELPLGHASGAQIEVPRHQKGLTLVVFHPVNQ